jgi:hypothetical protein
MLLAFGDGQVIIASGEDSVCAGKNIMKVGFLSRPQIMNMIISFNSLVQKGYILY